MPHIFFERLERRMSTQSILGNIPTNGLLGSSSYLSSTSSGISGPYGLPLSMRGPHEPTIYCYALGPPRTPEPPLGLWTIFEPELLKQTIWQNLWLNLWQNLWLNPSYTSPSWNYLNNRLSPIQNYWQTPFNYSPSWNYLNNWFSPIQNYWQTPFNYSPSWNYLNNWLSPITTYPWNTYMYNLSKLNNVRKGLLAFFQKKGILSNKQRQRLLSTPFEKA